MLILVDITKEVILSKISQEKIFTEFLQEPVDLDAKYFSPFRHNDTDPSCSFYYKRSSDGTVRLKFNDLGGDFNGDCFDYVGRLFGLNCNNKQDFKYILKIIGNKVGLHNNHLQEITKVDIKIREKKELYATLTDFDKLDYNYWQQGYITPQNLKDGNVFRVNLLFSDNKLIYTYSRNNPAYLYYFGKKESMSDIRIYFPKSKINKFITQFNTWQGLNLLKPSKNGILVITKSYKDVLAIHNFPFKGELIQAIAPPSETTYLTEIQLNYLKSKYNFKTIFTLFDYDRAGLKASFYHRKTFNTIPLYFKLPTWNTKAKYDNKDFWDNLIKINKTDMQKIIKETYDKYFP